MKLSEVHQTQLEEMVKKGTQPKIIRKHFKESYNIVVPYPQISALRKKFSVKTNAVSKKSGKKEPLQVEASGDLETLATEMVSIIKETREATKDVLLGVRLELLKSREEVFKMKRGLGRI